MHLSDLMNLDALHAQLTARHIARILSPDGRHWLYNYTDKATYAQAWTPETRQCRGLVTDRYSSPLPMPSRWCRSCGSSLTRTPSYARVSTIQPMCVYLGQNIATNFIPGTQ